MKKNLGIIAGRIALTSIATIVPHNAKAQGNPPVALTVTTAPDPALRQIHVRFEYVKVTAQKKNNVNELDALNLLTEEGHVATLSTTQGKTGAETRKQTITVTPRIEANNVVVLDIKEETETKTTSGEIRSNASETRVRMKNGETKVVSGQIAKRGKEGTERLLFVTSTIDTPAK